MGKHRPVSDRIAETQAQLSALLAKAAKDQVNESPEIQAIDNEIKGINTSMLKFNRWAAEGEEKIENFKQRVLTWENRLALATEKIETAKAELNTIRKKRKALAESLAKEIQLEA